MLFSCHVGLKSRLDGGEGEGRGGSGRGRGGGGEKRVRRKEER